MPEIIITVILVVAMPCQGVITWKLLRRLHEHSPEAHFLAILEAMR